EAGRGRAPVLGVGELLRLERELLLAGLRRGALAVELGEVRSAAPVERLARLREPLPQLLVGLAVDAADGAPLVEDRLEPVARLLPLRGLGGELLGLGGQRLLARDGRAAVRVAGRPGGLDRGLRLGDELVEPGAQPGEVADHGGLVQPVPDALGAVERVLRVAAARREPR